jgi:hypothetical protein
VIEAYLAEVLGLLPGSAYDRADTLTYYFSLRELGESVGNLSSGKTVEERRAAVDKHKAEGAPGLLKFHESAIKGPFYKGDKVIPLLF